MGSPATCGRRNLTQAIDEQGAEIYGAGERRKKREYARANKLELVV